MDQPSPAAPRTGSEATSERLLVRARAGDARAVSALVQRYLPSLRRWAHGRLPAWLRAVADTGDLIQNAVLQTMQRLHSVERRGEKALGAYLRQAVLNQIRDEHRRFERRGAHDGLAETLGDPGLSPFDEASYAEVKRKYCAALTRLRPADRELVVAHVELGYSHEQLGCMTGKRTNSARMALRRALDRLAEAMRDA
jgi:RNA polymerase sigma-70 factor, ECF subfamily